MPHLRRKRRMAYATARPWLKLGIRRRLNDPNVSAAERQALEFALANDDALEAAYDQLDEGLDENPPRDWAGFADAMVKILQALVPILEMILKLFAGGAVPA